MKTLPVRLDWFLALPLLFGAVSLSAQEESSTYDPFNNPAVMHIGYLNPDCVQDTVYGLLHRNLQWIPEYICWGNAFDSAGVSLCQEGGYDSTITAAEVRDTTRIEAPVWGRYSCALSVDRYNVNDTLDDLIFWIKGIDTVLGSRSERLPHDTACALVVFGQSGLETRERIELNAIKTFQNGPFYAMHLGVNTELINPKRRDNTRKTSWELKRVNRSVERAEQEDTTETPPPQTASVEAWEYEGRVWPNPTIYTTNVEIMPLPAGTYSVEVIAVNGARVWTSELEIAEEGKVFETVDLSGLPSGHYVLRVSTREKSFGVYPIIVVR